MQTEALHSRNYCCRVFFWPNRNITVISSCKLYLYKMDEHKPEARARRASTKAPFFLVPTWDFSPWHPQAGIYMGQAQTSCFQFGREAHVMSSLQWLHSHSVKTDLSEFSNENHLILNSATGAWGREKLYSAVNQYSWALNWEMQCFLWGWN